MDEHGFVYIVDRVKDMINVSGFKVWPAEVEQYLYKLDAIQEVAVFGIPHPQKGEQVIAAVVLREGSQLAAGDILAYCRETIASYKIPARIEIRESLPKSPTGKLLKRILRENATASEALNVRS
jgi:long-chain acyl-CoA synthetase